MTDPNGNPGCLRECVDRLPTLPKCSRVRARSAYDGSGMAGWSPAVPVLACFRMEEKEDMVGPSRQFKRECGPCTSALQRFFVCLRLPHTFNCVSHALLQVDKRNETI